MSLKLIKRLMMGALIVFAVMFIFNRPLPSRGNDLGANDIEGRPPDTIEQANGEQEPEATAEATAEPTEPTEPSEVSEEGLQTVSVGIYVISIDELNLAESYYVMSFYLSLTCPWPPGSLWSLAHLTTVQQGLQA